MFTERRIYVDVKAKGCVLATRQFLFTSPRYLRNRFPAAADGLERKIREDAQTSAPRDPAIDHGWLTDLRQPAATAKQSKATPTAASKQVLSVKANARPQHAAKLKRAAEHPKLPSSKAKIK